MVWGWLTWWRKRPDRGAWKVTLYTRAGCPLCDKAWALLQALQRRYGYQLEARDIGPEPELLARFGEKIPVVEINGRVRFWGRINAVLLRRLLDHG